MFVTKSAMSKCLATNSLSFEMICNAWYKTFFHCSFWFSVVLSLAASGSLWLPGSLWFSQALTGFLWLSLALADSLWLSLALSGSLWLSMALYGSHWLSQALSRPHWLFLALSGSLWLSLALTSSLWLSLWLSLAFFSPQGPYLARCFAGSCVAFLHQGFGCDSLVGPGGSHFKYKSANRAINPGDI